MYHINGIANTPIAYQFYSVKKSRFIKLTFMKTKQIFPAALITAALITCFNGCKKKTESPEKICKTCMAKDMQEGVTVKTQEVCSDEDEQSFRNTYSDYSISCQ